MSRGPSAAPGSLTCSARSRKFDGWSFAGVHDVTEVRSRISAQRWLVKFAPLVVSGLDPDVPPSQLTATGGWFPVDTRWRTWTPTNPMSGVYTSSSRYPATSKAAPVKLLRATFAERPTSSTPRVQFSGSPPRAFGQGQGKIVVSSSAFHPAHPVWLNSVENVSFLQTWVRWNGGWNSSPR